MVAGTITVALWERKLEAVTAARPFRNVLVQRNQWRGSRRGERRDMPALPPLEL